jgi:iron complex transport system permease protein
VTTDAPDDPAVEPEGAATVGSRSRSARVAAVTVALVLLVLAVAASLVIGSREVPIGTVLSILGGAGGAPGDVAAVVDLRLPRTAVAIVVGAGLAVAGAVIQAVTRNPLADPGILGVTSGSAFAVVLAVGLLGVTAPSGYLWFALAGAFLAAVVVYAIGSAGRGGPNPVRLTLAGVALGAVLAGVVSAIRLSDPRTFTALQTWESGAVDDRGWPVFVAALPFAVVGLVLAVAITGSLDAVSMGDDLAASLGTHIVRTRILAVVAVTLLTGAATAVAGPIAFVGLMIPHIARWFVGPSQRWIVTLSIALGPVLLLVADVLGRIVARPGEIPVGVVTAVVGAPVLIALVRRQRVSAL